MMTRAAQASTSVKPLFDVGLATGYDQRFVAVTCHLFFTEKTCRDEVGCAAGICVILHLVLQDRRIGYFFDCLAPFVVDDLHRFLDVRHGQKKQYGNDKQNNRHLQQCESLISFLFHTLPLSEGPDCLQQSYTEAVSLFLTSAASC